MRTAISNIINGFCHWVRPWGKRDLEYRIKPGRHRSMKLIPPGLPPDQFEIAFMPKFSESANVYVIDNPEQINKCIGIKEGLIPNRYSVILGFNTIKSNGNSIFKLHLFVNHDGEFESVDMGQFEPGQLGIFYLGMTKEKYYCKHGSMKYEIDRKNDAPLPKSLGIVEPYFGGKSKNPDRNENIDIYITPITV